MTEDQINIAANAIAGLSDAADCLVEDILEVLMGNVISDEDCGRIKRRIAQ